jgi:hypothetical protein
MWSRGGLVRNRRGSTLALMAVLLFGMLALSALAIDVASLRDARGEAQRAADAIALGGASAFYDLPQGDAGATQEATNRALSVARRNMVRGDTIDVRNPNIKDMVNKYPKKSPPITNDGQVRSIEDSSAGPTWLRIEILPAIDSQKVRVWVRRNNVGTFFAGLLGTPFSSVTAKSAAWAANNGPVVNCLKPFLIPDMWHESNKSAQDKNSNDYMEPDATANGNKVTAGEQWFYEPTDAAGNGGATGDYYAPFDPTVSNPPRPQTGYGSNFRGIPGDVGLKILFKPQTGNNQRQGNSYFTLDGPETNLRDDIKFGCINAGVGDTPNWSQGSATGQARQGLDYLINQDPSATWNPSTKQIENSAFPAYQSPRVIIVGLMHPKYIKGSSKNVKPDNGATFSNFARLFVDTPPSKNTDNLSGVFLGFAPGGAGGPIAGSLVRKLQLIE